MIDYLLPAIAVAVLALGVLVAVMWRARRLRKYRLSGSPDRHFQHAYGFPNGIYGVVSDLGKIPARDYAKGYRRFEVETSRRGHPGANLRYFPRRYQAHAHLRKEADL